jgi:hypothetical protein
MDSTLRKKVVAGATAAAVLAGAGGVYAATNDGDKEREAFTDNVAKRLDVSPEKLKDAIAGATDDRIDAAVKAGKLTEKQGEELKKRAKEHGGLAFGGPGFGPGGHREVHFHVGPGPFGGGEVAKYLGLSQAELRKRLESAKSLAEIAKAEGKSVDGLRKAMKDALEAKLDKAVENDDLTAKQRTKMLERFDEHLDDIVAGKPPEGPKGGFKMRGDGPRFGTGVPVGPGAPPPPPF